MVPKKKSTNLQTYMDDDYGHPFFFVFDIITWAMKKIMINNVNPGLINHGLLISGVFSQ